MVVYISCDIETDGPICNPNSILQLGAAAFDDNGVMLSTYSANLHELPGGSKCEKTMKWWRKQGNLYDLTREDLQKPESVMKSFDRWVRSQGKGAVFVAYPAAFDFSFVYWYLINFTGQSPFSHSALDIKTLAMVAMKTDYRSATKANMPRNWFGDDAHTHIAVEDAIEQGKLFFEILKELKI